MNRNNLKSGCKFCKTDLKRLVAQYRTEKKICRKCYCVLPLNAKICKKCHNNDLRLKHKIYEYMKKRN